MLSRGFLGLVSSVLWSLPSFFPSFPSFSLISVWVVCFLNLSPAPIVIPDCMTLLMLVVWFTQFSFSTTFSVSLLHFPSLLLCHPWHWFSHPFADCLSYYHLGLSTSWIEFICLLIFSFKVMAIFTRKHLKSPYEVLFIFVYLNLVVKKLLWL